LLGRVQAKQLLKEWNNPSSSYAHQHDNLFEVISDLLDDLRSERSIGVVEAATLTRFKGSSFGDRL
jgi:hypothetical protein